MDNTDTLGLLETGIVSEDIKDILEEVAAEIHNVWMRERIRDGWTWSEASDSTKKTHSSLIPYSELPESEKNYDRRTALVTIKCLMDKGFTIQKQC